MFEQSLLIDHAVRKRTGALALSITMQTLSVAVLLAIPLFYSDRLPVLKPWIPLSVPLSPPPPPPPIVETTENPPRGPVFTTREFVPTNVATHSPALRPPTIISLDGPVSATDITGQIGLPFVAPGLDRTIAVFIPPVLPVPVVKESPKPITVGGGVQAAKLIRRVIPPYPPLAKAARVSGTVHLVGVIAKDGTIQQLQLISGPSLLVKAALDAVRQWAYQPTLLNGEAVEVIAPIDVIFTLSQ